MLLQIVCCSVPSHFRTLASHLTENAIGDVACDFFLERERDNLFSCLIAEASFRMHCCQQIRSYRGRNAEVQVASSLQQVKRFTLWVFANNASFKRYGVICISRQRVRPYLVFVTSQASLLVKKANEILSTTRQ